MSTEFEVGTVAMVRSAPLAGEPGPEVRRIYGEYPEGQNGCWYEGHGGFVRAKNVASVRPLVVIDLAQTKGRSFLPGWLRNHATEIARASAGGVASVADDMRYIADQIEAVCEPPKPKPDEPTGLTARIRDAKGREWWRWSCDAHTTEPWARVGAVHLDMSDMQTSRWADIDAVEILSAGWSE